MTKALLLAAAALAAVPAIAAAQAVPPSLRERLNSPTGQAVVHGTVSGVNAVNGVVTTYKDCTSGRTVACGASVTGATAGAVELGAKANAGLLAGQQQVQDAAGLVFPVAAPDTPVDYSASIRNSERLATGAKVVGHAASGVSLGASAYQAYQSCSAGDTGNCVLNSAGTLASAAEMLPGPARAIGASFNAGVAVGGWIDGGYTWARGGKSMGEDLYDFMRPDEDAKIWAEAERQQGAMRARADSAYQASSSSLQAKQERYDAEQAEIQRQQIAAQQQAASAAQSQAFMGNLLASAQPQFPMTPALAAPSAAAPMSTPAAPSGACHPGHDEKAHPGGCHQGGGTAR